MKQKIRIKQTKAGSWRGYIGRKMIKQFADEAGRTAQGCAQIWFEKQIGEQMLKSGNAMDGFRLLGSVGGRLATGDKKRREVDYAALGRKGGLASRTSKEA